MDECIAVPLLEHAHAEIDLGAPLVTDNVTDSIWPESSVVYPIAFSIKPAHTEHTDLTLHLNPESLPNSFKQYPSDQFVMPKDISSTAPFGVALMAGMAFKGVANLCKKSKTKTEQERVIERPRLLGIYQSLTVDPLWATLPLQEKISISESPVQQAVWNTYSKAG